jgi:trans-aconitate 2-methyltransferase
MSGNPTWNPSQYLRFGAERLQPAIDLIGRLSHPAPKRVVDLGCGAGNALPLLAARFPGAEVTGVDGSPDMLAKAASGGFGTVQADIASWEPAEKVDVIFSNAALQWLPDHALLFPRLLSCLAPGGMLAVQMPAMDDTPARRLQLETAGQGPWAPSVAGVATVRPVPVPGVYYDLLRPLVPRLDLWVTEYVHQLQGADPVMQWFKGSSLQPYLDAMPQEMRPDFLAAYAEAIRPHYPPQTDGVTLLSFRRLFLIASLQEQASSY